MAEPNPTNQRLAQLLEDLADELRGLKEQQQQLTEEIRKLAGSTSG